jgi:23S rRNA pseudouridine1911/1915/1917 synthase
VDERTESGPDLQRWVRHGSHRVPEGTEETRLDRYLAIRFPYRSRAQWAQIIRDGRILFEGRSARPGQRLRAGVKIEYHPEAIPEPEVAAGVRTLHEDDWMIAVDKPANLPLHPSGKYFRNTLLSQLLLARGETLDAPGLRVVHRLDRETSGVVVFGKTVVATRYLAGQFEHRKATKSYLVLVHGAPPDRFMVDARLGPKRDSRIRKAVGVVPAEQGVAAQTAFLRLASGPELSLLEARPRTGRMHQIRVHLQHAGYPVVGDKMYGVDEALFLKLSAGEPFTEEDEARLLLPRQALHAWKLTLQHPRDRAPIAFRAPLPSDMRQLCSRSGIEWRDADGD